MSESMYPVPELVRDIAEAIYDWDMYREGYKEWRPFNLLASEVKDDYYEIAQTIREVVANSDMVEPV